MRVKKALFSYKMPFNKTALKKMKKDELVEHILKIQKEGATGALLSSDEETSTEAVFPKERQLQQLEKLNQGPINVNIDHLWELRAEKKRWEEEQKTPTEQDITNLKEENERLKKHIINNYDDLHPNGDGIPHTAFFPGGEYAIDEEEEKRMADAFAKKYPDCGRPQPRTPYSALCGQIGEGIEDLQGRLEDAEDEHKMHYAEIDELKKKVKELEDRNDELEDYYCDREEKLKEEIEKLKEQKEKEEEEGDSCCMGCEKRFCMYDAQKAEPEAYNKYFGSGDDDGDLCVQCLIKFQGEEDYKNFGVMMETEDGDEEDCGYFDTLDEAKVEFKEACEANPTARVVIFVSTEYNPDCDNIGTITIVEENREE